MFSELRVRQVNRGGELTTVSSPIGDLKWVICGACGSDAFRPLRKVGEWNVGRCSNCSLIYLNPMPVKKGAFADSSSSYYYTEFQLNITPSRVAFEKRQFLMQVTEYSRLTRSHPVPGRFLDVGCGPGFSVKAAIDCGWEAAGVDVDQNLIEAGRRDLGVELRCSDLTDCRFESDQFHFARLKSVLQFLPDPLDVLREVTRILAPGGIVLVIVPNEDGLPNSLKKVLGTRGHNRFGTLVLPHHLHAFSPRALEHLLKRAGLSILSLGTTIPSDPMYATIDQLREKTVATKARSLFWRVSKTLRRGSLLLGYAQKT